MKIPNKREFQQIAFNHSSYIDIEGFINLFKNVLQNHIFFFSFTIQKKSFRKNIKINHGN